MCLWLIRVMGVVQVRCSLTPGRIWTGQSLIQPQALVCKVQIPLLYVQCFLNANLKISFINQNSLLYFYPIYTCWSKGMKRESFSKRYWGKYSPPKVWAKFMKNTMPRTSVSNEFKVGVQTGKPPLRSHGDKWYFHSAIRRSWREGNPHSKVILTGEGSNASLNS